jgi:hypothetical protein
VSEDVGEWSSFLNSLRLLLLAPLPLPLPLVSSLISESSSGEHDDESSSRLLWFRRWCWSCEPLPTPELLVLPPDDELLPLLVLILALCLDFSCCLHLALLFLNQT